MKCPHERLREQLERDVHRARADLDALPLRAIGTAAHLERLRALNAASRRLSAMARHPEQLACLAPSRN